MPKPTPPVVRRPGPPPRPGGAPKPARRPLPEFMAGKDPLAGVEYTGDVEADVAAELGAVEAAFRAREEREATRMSNEIDSENWFAVVFETRAQKEEFLAKLNLLDIGDKYFDGRDIADRLGVALSPSGREYRPEPRIDPRFAALAEPVKYRK